MLFLDVLGHFILFLDILGHFYAVPGCFTTFLCCFWMF